MTNSQYNQQRPLIIQKSKRSQIRFEIRQYNGRSFVDIRSYFCTDDDPEYHPTKRGITISPDQYQLFVKHVIELGQQIGVPPNSSLPTGEPKEELAIENLFQELDRIHNEN